MNLEKLYETIDVLNTIGIKQALIEKDDEKTLLLAVDNVEDVEDPSIVIISKIDDDIVDNTMGIQRVQVLYNRMSLFDLSKTKIDVSDAGTFINRIEFKQGKRKTTYTFANPAIFDFPDDTLDTKTIAKINIDKDKFELLSKANQAINSEFFVLRSEGKDIFVDLYDNDSDSFSDVIGNNDNGSWSYQWIMNSVMKLIRYAIKKEGEAELFISDVGIMYITISGIMIMVMPQVA